MLSYRTFAALNQKGDAEARISYSDYCMFSAQQRYFDYDHFKKQMWKVHHLHLQSGYLKASRYTATTDTEGKPDWMMHYVPGPRAHAEFRAFPGRKAKDLFGTREDSLEAGEWRPESRGGARTPFVSAPSKAKAVELVRYFHRRARNVEVYELPPGGKERAQAEDLLRTYGEPGSRFVIDYGIRQAERTKFSMRVFGAIMQYVPDAIAAFEESQAASAESKAKERREADRKRAIEERYENERKALAALSKENRDALEAEFKADFLSRWPKEAARTESMFFKRMIENAIISKIMDGQDRSDSSDGQVRVS